MSEPNQGPKKNNVSREDTLNKLKDTELGNLLSWGIRRQLRWAVFTVSSIMVLIGLYYEIAKYFPKTAIISSFDVSKIWMFLTTQITLDSIGLVVIFCLATIALIFCEIKTIDYYRYVSDIEKMWLKKNEETNLSHQRAFEVSSRFDKFMMSKVAKCVLVSISLVIIVVMFILPF